MTTVPATLRFVRGPVSYFKSLGWTIHVLSSLGDDLLEFGKQQHAVVHTASLTRHISPLRDLRALLQITRIIRDIRPTVVHAHTAKAGLLSMLAATASARSTIRVYQVRGLAHEVARGPMRVLLRACERVSCSLAHRVFCDSASLQERAIADGVCARHKCTTLANGIGNGVDARVAWCPSSVSPQQVAALRAQLGVPETAPVVGYVGRLAKDKGIEELAHAWELLRRVHPAAHLVVAGRLDERDPAPAAALARLRGDASVHLVGQVSRMATYYAMMDVLVLPTYREGMPNVLLEAAAMAVPVVATRVTGCVDAVEDGVTGTLVEPHSGGALARAIAFYLSEEATRREHGRAARARVVAAFRPESVHEALRKQYDALLQLRAARANGKARRVVEVALVLVLLLITAPAFALITLAIRMQMGSPVLFRQIRPGIDGKPFTLHKFRTMLAERAGDGGMRSTEVRLTRLGRWLRRTSLDELPELWDVLRGRMSLIGPRPLLMEYLPLYTAEQARRHNVRPGITGWAQINGRNGIGWAEKLRLDVWYVDHATPGLDLRILLKTITVVLSRRDVSPPGRDMVEKFHGAST